MGTHTTVACAQALGNAHTVKCGFTKTRQSDFEAVITRRKCLQNNFRDAQYPHVHASSGLLASLSGDTHHVGPLVPGSGANMYRGAPASSSEAWTCA